MRTGHYVAHRLNSGVWQRLDDDREPQKETPFAKGAGDIVIAVFRNS
jgi:hypothetical protein